MHWHYTKKETRLAYPGERLILCDPITAHRVEQMRALQIRLQSEAAAHRWQRLGGRDACGDVVMVGAGMDERLIAEKLYEIESRCRSRGSNPCACDY